MRRLYWQFYNVDSSIQDNENNTESTNLSEKGSLDNILPQAIIEKSRGEGSLIEQDTIENVS